MLQGANTDLFNPLVPETHNSECRKLKFPSHIKLVKSVRICSNKVNLKSNLQIFICFTLGTYGLTSQLDGRFLQPGQAIRVGPV